MTANKQQKHGLHIDLPYNVGDTIYGVGVWNYCELEHSKDMVEKIDKKKLCREVGGEAFCSCDDCQYARPTIEKFVCFDITYSHERGLIIEGSEHQEYTPDYVFTSKAKAQVKLREMLKIFNANKEKRTPTREERNQYKREWYAKNKDKVKAANARYWQKKLATEQGEKK